MQPAPKISLNNGVLIDALGFGVYKVPADECAGLVRTAFDAGYRTIDTAALYANEEGVGQAVRAAVAEGTDREDIFVTSKVWNDRHGYQETLDAFGESMDRLGLDYLDLFLIHWPCPEQDQYIPTYKALETLYHEGKVRAIGVSNFEPDHLERLLEATEVVPAVNQVELHPWLQQKTLRALHEQLGIRTQAWSPLARGQLLDDPELGRIAAAHNRTVAQIVLRWHLEIGNLVIPKASTPARVRENLDVFDFTLSNAELAAIESMDRGHHSGSSPLKVN